MTNNEILIGRDNSCHIRINPECRYCSGIHGALYMSGNTLMYRDQSRNGTTINNNMVRQQTVPIKYGDTIMLAGQYRLDWNIICSYFPQAQQMPAHTIIKPQDNPQYQQEYRPEYRPEEKRTPNLHKFNWGAFFLYPIWGLFNGCWWALLVAIFCCWGKFTDQPPVWNLRHPSGMAELQMGQCRRLRADTAHMGTMGTRTVHSHFICRIRHTHYYRKYTRQYILTRSTRALTSIASKRLPGIGNGA